MSDAEERKIRIYSETISYPVPAQLKRIIELLDEREREAIKRYWVEFLEGVTR